jgi:hypothetical protein
MLIDSSEVSALTHPLVTFYSLSIHPIFSLYAPSIQYIFGLYGPLKLEYSSLLLGLPLSERDGEESTGIVKGHCNREAVSITTSSALYMSGMRIE